MPVTTIATALLASPKVKTAAATVKLVKGLVKTGRTIRERFLKKKIEVFLKTTNDLNETERIAMMKMIDDDKDGFYERLWHFIDINDSEFKTEIIARLGKAVARKQIDVEDFFVVCKIVNDAHTSDLRYAYDVLKGKLTKSNEPKNKPTKFVQNGDFVFRLSNAGITSGQSPLSMTPYGKMLFLYGFDGITDSNLGFHKRFK